MQLTVRFEGGKYTIRFEKKSNSFRQETKYFKKVKCFFFVIVYLNEE